MDKNLPLVQQLDEYRPDKPSCEETLMKDKVDQVLLTTITEGKYAGMTNIQALVTAKVKHAIEHPESVSLGDIAKISAERKKRVEVDVGTNLADMFRRMDEQPETIIGPNLEDDD